MSYDMRIFGRVIREHEFDGEARIQFFLRRDTFEYQELNQECRLYDDYLKTVNRILGKELSRFWI